MRRHCIHLLEPSHQLGGWQECITLNTILSCLSWHTGHSRVIAAPQLSFLLPPHTPFWPPETQFTPYYPVLSTWAQVFPAGIPIKSSFISCKGRSMLALLRPVVYIPYRLPTAPCPFGRGPTRSLWLGWVRGCPELGAPVCCYHPTLTTRLPNLALGRNRVGNTKPQASPCHPGGRSTLFSESSVRLVCE